MPIAACFGAENPLFFQGKKLLPDVGIFRKISKIRKHPGGGKYDCCTNGAILLSLLVEEGQGYTSGYVGLKAGKRKIVMFTSSQVAFKVANHF